MNYIKLRDFAFLSQASYRGLALPRNATTAALEAALRAEVEGVLSPANRFADPQAKMLTGSAKGASVELFSPAMI